MDILYDFTILGTGGEGGLNHGIEVVKEFTRKNIKFYDEHEFNKLVELYDSMKNLYKL